MFAVSSGRGRGSQLTNSWKQLGTFCFDASELEVEELQAVI